jgi:primosomal protein N'
MRDFAAGLRENAEAAHAEILGPAPAALSKIRNAHRMHVLIKGDYPNQLEWLLNLVLQRFGPKLPKKIKLRLDRDPVSLL